jgi:hypothetical protein
MTESERLARAAIEKTLAACTQAGDARKAQAYSECFTSEGILDLGEPRLEGRDAIRRYMQAPSPIPQPRARAPGYVSHHLTTCRIELTSASTATVRTYWLVTTVIGLDHNGYYDDAFVRVDDDWLIASRRPRTLWKNPGSLVA